MQDDFNETLPIPEPQTYGQRFLASLAIRRSIMHKDDGVNGDDIIEFVQRLLDDQTFAAAITKEDVIGYVQEYIEDSELDYFGRKFALDILQGVYHHCEGAPMPWDPKYSDLSLRDFQAEWDRLGLG